MSCVVSQKYLLTGVMAFIGYLVSMLIFTYLYDTLRALLLVLTFLSSCTGRWSTEPPPDRGAPRGSRAQSTATACWPVRPADHRSPHTGQPCAPLPHRTAPCPVRYPQTHSLLGSAQNRLHGAFSACGRKKRFRQEVLRSGACVRVCVYERKRSRLGNFCRALPSTARHRGSVPAADST